MRLVGATVDPWSPGSYSARDLFINSAVCLTNFHLQHRESPPLGWYHTTAWWQRHARLC